MQTLRKKIPGEIFYPSLLLLLYRPPPPIVAELAARGGNGRERFLFLPLLFFHVIEASYVNFLSPLLQGILEMVGWALRGDGEMRGDFSSRRKQT